MGEPPEDDIPPNRESRRIGKCKMMLCRFRLREADFRAFSLRRASPRAGGTKSRVMRLPGMDPWTLKVMLACGLAIGLYGLSIVAAFSG